MYDDEFFDTPIIGQTLVELLAKTIEPKPQLHDWLPAGLSLLAGKAKAGKSALAEQIANKYNRRHLLHYKKKSDNFSKIDCIVGVPNCNL